MAYFSFSTSPFNEPMKTKSLLSLLLVGLVLVSQTARSERLEEGTVEIGGNFMYDHDTALGGELELSLLGGYYVSYGWLVGGEFQLSNNDYTTHNAFMANVERSFEIGDANEASPFIPYAGAMLGYARASFKGADDKSGLLLGGKAGMKLMLTGELALDFSLYLNLSTDDVYYDDGGPCKTDIGVRLGLRTFLF